MDKSFAKHLIAYYQQWATAVEIVPRDYTIEPNLNYVFVGLRRAGKSYLMYQQIQRLIAQGHKQEEILYFNFEDDRIGQMVQSDLDLIKQAYEEMYDTKPIFFLDEIQEVDGWEKFARRLADTGYRVYITGSNAKMLSSEIATTLGGRYMMCEVYPFSFREYLKANGIDATKKNALYSHNKDIRKLFEQYFTYGALPELMHIHDKRSWLSSLFGKIFFGDMITRHGIRNDFSLRILIRKLAESVMQPSSYRRMANLVTSVGKKLSTDATIEYIGYMCESWLILPYENYSAKLNEKESNRKYYFIDNGLLNLFLINPDTALLENMVAIRLRQLYKEDVYFYNEGIEVDFLLPEQGTAIQVSYSLNDPETRKREVGALEKLSQRMAIEKRIIITKDEEESIESDTGNIEVIPLYKWLLK